MDDRECGGELCEISITGLTHDGNGVGRENGRVIFVPSGLPGDRLRARVVEKKSRYWIAERQELVSPSTERIAARCPHAAECGGCHYQELRYSAQLHWKKRQVEDALRRIGRVEQKILPVIGMETPWHYRNKAQFPLSFDRDEVKIGYYRRGTHSVVDIEECPVLPPLMVDLLQVMRQVISRQREQWKSLRHLVIRNSFSEEKLMLALVSRNGQLPPLEEWLPEVRGKVPQLVSIVHNINNQKGSQIWGRETLHLAGEESLYEEIASTRYAISPGSFFQINPIQTKVLYDQILEMISPCGEELVLDLFSGAGTIALYLAPHVRQAVGVESFAPAVLDAKRNSQLNQLHNVEWISGRSEEWLPRLFKRYRRVDWVVVDPPREGCARRLLDAVVEQKVEKMIYVSCNPSTLARDLLVMREGGYRVERVQPIDLFPWTAHIETVVLLTYESD